MPDTASRSVFALVDLSSCNETSRKTALRRLNDALGATVPRAFVIGVQPDGELEGWLPTGNDWRPACEGAFARSAELGAHLLVITGSIGVTDRSLGQLLETFDEDPLFGIAHPRFVDEHGTQVLPPLAHRSATEPVSAAVLPLIGSRYIVPEAFSACLLIRWELVANVRLAAGPWTGMSGLLTEYTVRCRRSGYRSVVGNRATVSLAPLPETGVIAPDPVDAHRIRERYPETSNSASFLASRPESRVEEMLSLALEQRALLIDARNLGAMVNGTSKAILGLMDGLQRVRGSHPTTLWVSHAAATYHSIAARYPAWHIATGSVPPARYPAAVRLSQPWDIKEIFQLAEYASAIAYYMHDAISWDVQYTAPPALDTVWRLAAECADGLIFNSEFSRRRFAARFVINQAVQTEVVRLSLDPRDYVQDSSAETVPQQPFWFVVGNAYDHKHVTPTLDALTRAFPNRAFVVVGDRALQRGARVIRLHSGSTREAVMQAHYARSDAVIFPSFYEGFALPIWNGLAYGRTVVARDSALVRELAALYRGPGRLLVFDSEATLLSCLAKLSHGLDLSAHTIALSDTDPVHDWNRAAADLDSFLARLVAGVSTSPLSKIRALAGAVAAYSGTVPAVSRTAG
jgi:glycosyltransferase involved in cell wall biosynthesis